MRLMRVLIIEDEQRIALTRINRSAAIAYSVVMLRNT
jgi:hypothetical protein